MPKWKIEVTCPPAQDENTGGGPMPEQCFGRRRQQWRSTVFKQGIGLHSSQLRVGFGLDCGLLLHAPGDAKKWLRDRWSRPPMAVAMEFTSLM